MTVHKSFISLDPGTRERLFRIDASKAGRVDDGIKSATSRYGESITAVDSARCAQMGQRFDSLLKDETDLRLKTEKRLQARIDAKEKRGERRDSFDATAGLFLARELEHRYTEVLREPLPKLDAFDRFFVDTTVQPGAKTHTARRLYGAGEVKVIRGGSEDLGTVKLNQVEEQFPVRHYGIGLEIDIFELASSNFANFALYAEELRTARDLTMRFANRATWHGIPDAGVYGVLNYPWLAKSVSSVNPNTATGDEEYSELMRLGNYAANASYEVFAPDAVIMSTRLYNHFAAKRLGSVNDTKVLQDFLANHPTITEAYSSPYLQGVGPGGTDGILFYRRDRLGISNVIVQPFTTLPIERRGFVQQTACYMSHGGVIMRDAGHNLLTWMTAPTV